MVDDDDVAFHRLAAHFRDEAALDLATLLPRAGIGAGIRFVPKQAGCGQFGEYRAIPSRSVLLPSRNSAVLLNLIETAEHRVNGHIVQSLEAKIVLAAFHVAKRH